MGNWSFLNKFGKIEPNKTRKYNKNILLCKEMTELNTFVYLINKKDNIYPQIKYYLEILRKYYIKSHQVKWKEVYVSWLKYWIEMKTEIAKNVLDFLFIWIQSYRQYACNV